MRAFVVSMFALTAGCSSLGNYRSTDTLAPGDSQVLVAPQVHSAGPSETRKAPFPELAVGYRHGIAPRTEAHGTVNMLLLGEVVTTLGAELGGKRHLYRSGSGRYELALAASVGYRYVSTSGASWENVHAAVPLIAGIRIGEDQLAISPTVAWQRWYSSSAMPVSVPSAGLSVGYRWRINQRWTLLPELSWAYTPVALSNFDDTILGHAGVGVIYNR